MKLFRHILLSAVCACSLRAFDCVPLTYKTLTELIDTPVSYETWQKNLMPDGKTPPLLRDSIKAWNTMMPKTPLECIFISMKGVDIDTPIEYGVPYFWVGFAPANLTVDGPPDVPGELTAHAAIAIITAKHEYFIMHTINPTEYYVERLNEADFFERTFAVFRVRSKTLIPWQPLFPLPRPI